MGTRRHWDTGTLGHGDGAMGRWGDAEMGNGETPTILRLGRFPCEKALPFRDAT